MDHVSVFSAKRRKWISRYAPKMQLMVSHYKCIIGDNKLTIALFSIPKLKQLLL